MKAEYQLDLLGLAEPERSRVARAALVVRRLPYYPGTESDAVTDAAAILSAADETILDLRDQPSASEQPASRLAR